MSALGKLYFLYVYKYEGLVRIMLYGVKINRLKMSKCFFGHSDPQR